MEPRDFMRYEYQDVEIKFGEGRAPNQSKFNTLCGEGWQRCPDEPVRTTPAGGLIVPIRRGRTEIQRIIDEQRAREIAAEMLIEAFFEGWLI